MQDADPYNIFEQRNDGQAETQEQPPEAMSALQQQPHQVESREGEPATSQPDTPGPREGNEGDTLARELTHSESGEGSEFFTRIDSVVRYCLPFCTRKQALLYEQRRYSLVPYLVHRSHELAMYMGRLSIKQFRRHISKLRCRW